MRLAGRTDLQSRRLAAEIHYWLTRLDHLGDRIRIVYQPVPLRTFERRDSVYFDLADISL